MKLSRRDLLSRKLESVDSIPTVSAILQPLLAYLHQPLDSLDMQRVVDLISHDKSLTAQCLHMANSPLFGRWQTVTSTRSAVIALGLQRMREIALSCCVLKLIPANASGINPEVFWEHSLACALVSRRFAKRIGVKDPEHAYLAGLLHDLGIVVNLMFFAEEFGNAISVAAASGRSVDEVEREILGFDHCESGSKLADQWEFGSGLREVVRYHHEPSALANHKALIAIVNLSDRLCRINGLGYGYPEELLVNWAQDPFALMLQEEYPIVKRLDWSRFSRELADYLNDVKKLVGVLYRLN